MYIHITYISTVIALNSFFSYLAKLCEDVWGFKLDDETSASVQCLTAWRLSALLYKSTHFDRVVSQVFETDPHEH